MPAGWIIFAVLLTASVMLMIGASVNDRERRARGGHMHSFGRDRACLTSDGRVLE